MWATNNVGHFEYRSLVGEFASEANFCYPTTKRLWCSRDLKARVEYQLNQTKLEEFG
jgi:hypothetical protein